MSPCRNSSKKAKRHTIRKSGSSSARIGATARPASSRTPPEVAGEASWQRIAAAVEAANADLLAQNARMTRSLRLLRRSLAAIKCERDCLLGIRRAR